MQAEADVLACSQTDRLTKNVLMYGCSKNTALHVNREVFIGTTLYL